MASAALQKIIENTVGHRIYCAPEKDAAVLRFKKEALTQPYLQLNPLSFISVLVLDVDRAGAAESWEDGMLPPPTFVAINKENAHAHIGYVLSSPVCRTDAARLKPLQFVAAIQWAYNKRVKGDLAFVGPISKNPLHPRWDVWEPSNAPTYELHELAEYVDLPQILPPRVPGIGRNCDLFEDLSKWAYRAIRDCWGPGKEDLWFSIVLNQAQALNTFNEPLAYSEYKGIARSVARYTWRKTTPDGFLQYQSNCGRLGGVASGESRRAQSVEKRIEADLLFSAGLSQRAIAERLDINQSTVSRWFRPCVH